MKRGKLQCKDIPDIPILAFLHNLPKVYDFPNRGTWFFGFDNSVNQSMPNGIGEKLVLAKMGMLIRRNLVTGCACGCRGDFYLTEKGKQHLEQHMGSVNRTP